MLTSCLPPHGWNGLVLSPREQILHKSKFATTTTGAAPCSHGAMAPRSHGAIEQWNHEPMVSDLQGDEGKQLVPAGVPFLLLNFCFYSPSDLLLILDVAPGRGRGAGGAAQEAEWEQVCTRQRPPAFQGARAAHRNDRFACVAFAC